MKAVLRQKAVLFCAVRFLQSRTYAGKIPKPFGTLAELQEYASTTFPNNKAFGSRSGDSFKWITYAEFGEMVNNVRAGLASLGVTAGNAVALISNNRVEWAAVCYAAQGLGAYIVPMYEVQKPSEWEFIVKNSGAVVAFVAQKKLVPVAEAWLKGKGDTALCHVISFEGGASENNCFFKLMETGKKNPVKRIQSASDDIAALIYTSGTTGVPKGVELTHGNILSNVHGLHQIWKDKYTDNDSVLSFLPWAHVYGQSGELHHLVSMGSAIGISTSPQHVLEELPMVQPNFFVAVPTIFNRIHAAITVQMNNGPAIKKLLFNQALQAAAQRRNEMNKSPVGTLNPPVPALVEMKYKFYDKLVFSKIREKMGGRITTAVSGGAALHKEVQQFFNDCGILIVEGYGLTETSPVIAVTNLAPTVKLQDGLGFFPGATLEICEPDGGSFLPRGEEGEVVVTGPGVMKQYHNLPEATEEVFFERDGKRYFKTGDMGIITKDNKLRITGRVKELYKLENGKWVAPAPTENMLMLVPYLQQVMLFGTNRPHNILLVTLNVDNVKKRLSTTSDVKVDDPNVVKLVVDGIQKQLSTGKIKKYEAPQRVYILPEVLTVESGLLTPKMSMKRPLIVKKFAKMIEDMYAGTLGHPIKLSKDMKD